MRRSVDYEKLPCVYTKNHLRDIVMLKFTNDDSTKNRVISTSVLKAVAPNGSIKVKYGADGTEQEIQTDGPFTLAKTGAQLTASESTGGERYSDVKTVVSGQLVVPGSGGRLYVDNATSIYVDDRMGGKSFTLAHVAKAEDINLPPGARVTILPLNSGATVRSLPTPTSSFAGAAPPPMQATTDTTQRPALETPMEPLPQDEVTHTEIARETPAKLARELLVAGVGPGERMPINTSRTMQLFASEEGRKATRRFYEVVERAIEHENDIYNSNDPGSAIWEFVTQSGHGEFSFEDTHRVLTSRGPGSDTSVQWLQRTPPNRPSELADEVKRMIDLRDDSNDGTALIIYAQESLAELADRKVAFDEDRGDARAADPRCSASAIILPYVDDGCASDRAALLLAALSFRDRTLAQCAADIIANVRFRAAPAEPLAALKHTHSLGTTALSDAAFDRVGILRKAARAALDRIVRRGGGNGAQCIPQGEGGPWHALALARMIVSSTVELQLACMRSRDCDKDGVIEDRDTVPKGEGGTDERSAAALQRLDQRFGTSLAPTWRSLHGAGYNTSVLDAAASDASNIMSATAQAFIPLPPVTTKELRIGLHAHGALQVAANAGNDSPFLRELALSDARRPWTHVLPDGQEWGYWCVSSVPPIESFRDTQKESDARTTVQELGNNVTIAVRAATEEASRERSIGNPRELASHLMFAVSDLLNATMTLTVALAATTRPNQKYIERIQQAHRKQMSIQYQRLNITPPDVSGTLGARPSRPIAPGARVG